MGLVFNYDLEVDEEFENQDYLDNKLVEIFVDPGYELEYLDDVDKFYLEKLRERFETRKEEYLSYTDLRAAMYELGNTYPKRRRPDMFFIIHSLRRYWRAGQIRRFVKGRTRKKIEGRGGWYGIHYKLYPERKR